MNEKILIVDDEPAIIDLLSSDLAEEGYQIETATDGLSAIDKAKSFNPDLIMLDVMLPNMSGYDVCRKINEFMNVPIILVTAKSDIVDKIIGLELGADDYLTKPFDGREMLARVKAHLRRRQKVENENLEDEKVIKNGPLVIVPDERKVSVENKEIHLTPKEFDLLYLLADNIEQVFKRDTLLEKIWGYDYFGDTRTVDMHIQRIRKKIDVPPNKFIQTVFGVGYKMRRI